MILVSVKCNENPSVRGVAFARDWTELYWVIDNDDFVEMDWDYVRSHNKPPVHLDKIFRLSGDSTKI